MIPYYNIHYYRSSHALVCRHLTFDAMEDTYNLLRKSEGVTQITVIKINPEIFHSWEASNET